MSNIFDKYKEGLKKTKKGFFNKLVDSLFGKEEINFDLIEEVEDILLQADLGYTVVSDIIEKVEKKYDKSQSLEVLFKDALHDILKGKKRELTKSDGLNVYFFVGVNGVGKTTTISKIGKKLKDENNKVLLAAGDTYRAAGVTQMQKWADKLDLRVITQKRGADAAALVYDAIESAISNNYDYLLVDTAGRLHTRTNLMNELEKINRTINKKIDKSNIENILVVDATTGQNALKQVEKFKACVDIDSIIITKMDGTAKGGIIFPMEKIHNIPVKYIGLGEKEDDLQKYNPEMYIETLFEK